MEVLRHSIEQLSAPICSHCNVAMAWSRSALLKEERVHVFSCPSCNATAETKTPVRVSKE